jgi:DNA polymerase III subunit beta
MRVKINQSELSSRLTSMQSILSRKTPMPVLTNVLLSWEDSQLRLSGTDLMVSITSVVKAETIDSGEVAINLRMLTELIRELPNGDFIDLELEEDSKLRITSNAGSFLIMGIRAVEYPSLSGLDISTKSYINSQSLAEMLNKTLFSVSQDDVRPNLGGIYFESLPDIKSLRLVGTDGHRLAVVTRSGCDGISESIIVPRRALVEIKKMLEDFNNNDVGIQYEHGFLIIKFEHTKVALRTIDGQYPNYNNVIPQVFGKKAKFSSTDVLHALRRVSLMVTDKSGCIKLNFTRDNLCLSGSSPDIGDAKEDISIDFPYESHAFGCNARYLSDVLTYIGEGKELVLDLLEEELAPIRCYAPHDESAFSILMPMRLDNDF